MVPRCYEEHCLQTQTRFFLFVLHSAVFTTASNIDYFPQSLINPFCKYLLGLCVFFLSPTNARRCPGVQPTTLEFCVPLSPPRVSPSPLTPRGCPAFTVKARFWGATRGAASSVQPPTTMEQENMDPASREEGGDGRRRPQHQRVWGEEVGVRWGEAEAGGPADAAQLAGCQHAATTGQAPGPGPSTKPPIRAEGSQGLGEILSVFGNKTRTQKPFSRNVLKGLRVLVENHRMTALGLATAIGRNQEIRAQE